jgi:phage/plasmid-associated DNA primase
MRATLPEGTRYLPNDAGRAEQFIDRHQDSVRFVPSWEKWLMWSGHHWRPDCDGAIVRLAAAHSKNLIAQAARINDHKLRESAVKEALAMGNTKWINAMLELAECDARIVAQHEQLDANPYLPGVKNGVIELPPDFSATGDVRT